MQKPTSVTKANANPENAPGKLVVPYAGITRALLFAGLTLLLGLWLLLAGEASVSSGGEPIPSAGRLPRAAQKSLAPVKLAPAWIGVCTIQGAGFESPHAGKQRVTRGIVVADFDDHGLKGFFIEDATCDENPNTSNGLFIYLGERIDIVQLGDLVQVGGEVQEFFGQTELFSSPAQVSVLSQGHPLPESSVLDPPFDNGMARFYYESLEGMQVSLDAGRVVGPTSAEGKTWVIDAALGQERVFHDDPGGTGEVIALSGEGLASLSPPAAVGDLVGPISGVMGYSFGEYEVYLISEPGVRSAVADMPSGNVPAGSLLEPTAYPLLDLATFNVENLFDPFDDPNKEDPIVSPAAYDRKLEKLAAAIHGALGEPSLIALQEVENDLVLADLLNRPELEADYAYVWVEGPDVRGIDTALMYRKDHIEIQGFEQRQGCTALIDGLGPDGNRDIQEPENLLTCDLDGDGVLDGNRLFSRPPLVVHASLCLEGCATRRKGQAGQLRDFHIIVNHWKSKSQDTFWTQYTLPRRLQQAQFVAGLLPELENSQPELGVFVVGDLNDHADSGPLDILGDAGLHDALVHLEKPERYTFIYRGVSQVLDYVLHSPAFGAPWVEPSIQHINVDYPEILAGEAGTAFRSADHDPVLVRLTFFSPSLFTPMIVRPP